MDPVEQFAKERSDTIAEYATDAVFQASAKDFLTESMRRRYVYNFDWLGRPIIQGPADMIAMQEIIWNTRPDVIVETGIAHGGSLILSASLLSLLDLCDATERGEILDPSKPVRRVIGVDIDIRKHNRDSIEAHPMSRRISMLQGSSIDPPTVGQVRDLVGDAKRVLVCLDSNHTHDHVLAELEAYAPLVSPGSYCVVFDTIVEDLPAEIFPDRPWSPGNNPKTAVHTWLPDHPEFKIDKSIDQKLMISVAPDGYLKRRSD